MTPFRRTPDGAFLGEFEPIEAALLTQLASQVAGILSADGEDRHPALVRLLPDAYSNDREASAEFRRFTNGDLVSGKVQNAQRIIADVAPIITAEGTTAVTLDGQGAGAWVRALTDIRLVLAVRLNIVQDGDIPPEDDELIMVGDLYDWLGGVQDTLVTALDDD